MKRLLTATTIIALIAVTSCKDQEVAPDANIGAFKGTQSPGDVWDWELNYDENTFVTVWDFGTFENTSDDITISGDFEVLPSGFLQFTINGVSPSTPEIPADGSAFFYALHLPNMTMIIKPEGSIKGDIISAVAAGDCADVPGEYNYFVLAPGNGDKYDPITEEAYGRVTFLDVGNGASSINGDKFSLDCANGGPCTVNSGINDSPNALCNENGTVEVISNNEVMARGQFTSSGAMMLDYGMGNGGILAFDKSKSFDFQQLEGETFTGLVYLPANQNNKSEPVKITFASSGNALLGTASVINDVTTGEISNESVSIRYDSNDQGIWLGEITHNGNISTFFASSLLESDGKKMMIISSTDTEEKPFILVAVADN